MQASAEPMGKTTLVTGATGFIGSHVARTLVSDGGCEVVAIVRDSAGSRRADTLRRQGVVLWEGTFHDPELLRRVFSAQGIRRVVHCAAIRGAGRAREDEYETINVSGTRSLAEASLEHGVESFVHCSSVGVYGTIPQELPATLSTPLKGDSAYHASKIMAEREIQRIEARGLRAFIVRPTITYGAGDAGFPATLVRLVKTRRLPVPAGDTMIHLVDVESLARLITHYALSAGDLPKVIVAADESPVSLHQLADLIHHHYHGRGYPARMRFPDAFFRMASAFFQRCGNHRWLTRVQLVSRSWYFDVSELMRIPGYCPSRTPESFMRAMCL